MRTARSSAATTSPSGSLSAWPQDGPSPARSTCSGSRRQRQCDTSVNGLNSRTVRPNTVAVASTSPPAEAFAFRLFLGVALTILAAGLGAYGLIDRRVRAEDRAAAAVALKADIAAAGRGRPSHALAHMLRERAGVTAVAILNRRGRTVAGQRILHRDGAFVVRAAGPGHRSVLRQQNATPAAQFLTVVRESLLILSLPAIFASLGLFWMLSGRVLHRRHLNALDRATRDGLTDLGNHRAFQDELRRAGAIAQRSG